MADRAQVEVRLKLLGPLGRLAGQRESTVSVAEGATVLDLLTALADRCGPAFAAAVFRAPGAPHTHLRVFLDDDDAEVDAPLRGAARGVTLMVLPVFEGGSA